MATVAAEAVTAALAHCRRDEAGLLLLLSDLWRGGRSFVAKFLMRCSGFRDKVVAKRGGFYRGTWAAEVVAREIACQIPLRNLWRESEVAEAEEEEEEEEKEENEEEEGAAGGRLASAAATPAEDSVAPQAAPPEAAPAADPAAQQWTLASRAYDGLAVVRRVCDGYFNATQLCSHFGKRFKDYEKAARAAEYLDALARHIVSEETTRDADGTILLSATRDALVQTQRGGLNQGTWVHERVALDLARWLSPAFAVWMDGWVLEALGLASAGQSSATPASQRQPQEQLPLGPPLHVPPTPEVIRHERSVALPGSGHLYAARRQPDGLTKIGVSKDPLDRMPELQRSFQAPYDLLAVWPGEEALEELVLDKLRPHRAALGASREHFGPQVTLDYVRAVVDCARELHRTKLELAAQSFEQRKRELELQADLEDRAVKRRLAQEDLDDRAAKRKRDDLLRSLVEAQHPEATRVFLQQFRAA